MATRDIIFDTDSLLRLLTHYTDGEVPLDAKMANFLLNQRLQRFIGLEVHSSQWDCQPDLVTGQLPPLQIRYKNDLVNRLTSWTEGSPEAERAWRESPEAPKRQ
jgi:hypothetical protein